MNWLLLRGLGRDSRHWGNFPSILESHLTDSKTFVLDLPGFGTERHRISPLTVKRICDDTRSRWNEIKRQHSGLWNLLSISFGGMVTMDWLNRFPSDFQNAVIINGYSGDFLFGGHIPEKLVSNPTMDSLCESLIEKHCSHINNDKLEDGKRCISLRICEELEEVLGGDHSVGNLCAGYEYWDWRERQAKAVVNGQRVYECFGLDWLLPLWDKELVEFWSAVRLEDKVNQKFHVEYLKYKNFRGVFTKLRSVNQLWLPAWRWMPYLGKVVEIASSNKNKQKLYERMFYFGYFRNQLGLFGFDEYKKHYQKLRRPRVVPLAAMMHLAELGIDYSEFIDS